jgi:hypothetical protein
MNKFSTEEEYAAFFFSVFKQSVNKTKRTNGSTEELPPLET